MLAYIGPIEDPFCDNIGLALSTLAEDVTQLLRLASAGDRDAEGQLFLCVYAELKRLARYHLLNERPGHTLGSTALVNEAYLRLTKPSQREWQGRTHFFALASKVMRRILVDYARRRRTAKRGGVTIVGALDETLAISAENCSMVLGVHEALERLASQHPRMAQVVEFRFFGGLTEEQIAEHLGLSARTVKRDWNTARAWLYGELSKG